jgi:hypothetical protein
MVFQNFRYTLGDCLRSFTGRNHTISAVMQPQQKVPIQTASEPKLSSVWVPIHGPIASATLNPMV